MALWALEERADIKAPPLTEGQVDAILTGRRGPPIGPLIGAVAEASVGLRRDLLLTRGRQSGLSSTPKHVSIEALGK